jgi:hypothetical protein
MALDLGGDLDAMRSTSQAAHTFLGFCGRMLQAPVPLRYFYGRFDDGQAYTYNDGALTISYPGLGRGTLEELDAQIGALERVGEAA